MALITSAFTSAIVIASVTAIPALYRRKSKLVKASTNENGEKPRRFIRWRRWFCRRLFSL